MFLDSSSIDTGSDHLRVVFGQQMGLCDQDIVALSGGHTLVRMIPEVSLVILRNYHVKIFNCCLFWICSFCREGPTRSDLALRDPGLPTLSSLITHTSRELHCQTLPFV